MKNRRYFLKQGSLATIAMLALKPLNTFAGVVSPFTGFNSSSNRLVFLHTANINGGIDHKAIQFIKDIKNRNAGTILLNAGESIHDDAGSLAYDASNNTTEFAADYKIITRGNIKTGFISAKPGDRDVIQKINELAVFLKTEKNCKVVVCLSLLGYKNTNNPDDVSLAVRSTHVDIIIGGHSDNFKADPIIMLNKLNAEVIIHTAVGDATSIGKIEIDFDEQGSKKQVNFNDQLSARIKPGSVITAA